MNTGDYSPDADFLGEPDEPAGEVQAERKRDEIAKEMMLQGSPTRKPTARDLVSDKRSRPATPSKLFDDERETPRPSAFMTPTKANASSRAGTTTSLLGLPFSPESPGRPAKRARTRTVSNLDEAPLPPPLADLVTLHAAIESAIIVHLGSSGSAVASSVSEFDANSRATMRVPNLIHLSELSKMVRCGQKQLTETELARLVWAWKGCGLPSQEGPEDVVKSDDEDDLQVTHSGHEETGGLGFIVSSTRTNKSSNIQMGYSLGIEVQIKANPQLPALELVSHSPTSSSPKAPVSPSSAARGRDGMNVVVLWTSGKEARRQELSTEGFASDLDSLRYPERLPAIPLARLPSLTPAKPCIIGTPSPSPKKKRKADVSNSVVPVAGSQNQSVLMLLEGKPSGPVHPTLKASERNRLMRERLAAKYADAQKPIANHAFLSSLSGDGFKSTKKSLRSESSKPVSGEQAAAREWQTVEKETYKRNAMVSRLGNVADVVVLLSLKSSGKPMLMNDVASAVAYSPLVHVGQDEAYESLEMLCHLFPDFAQMRTLDRQDWLYVKRGARAVDVKSRVASELETVRGVQK
ncbi:hypothetical protein OIV83_005574 [Microbotryomycetes sp. JL201]|nr:hypothetical protein OIV83_005574 [Microbotryomycetes sp. JL201]